MKDLALKTCYTNSHALIIGINEYKTVSPLGYAVNDAEAVAAILKTRFGFDEKNICLLLDKRATQKAISFKYMSYVTGPIERDDRIVVFFAGHGITHRGPTKDAGFMVPYDGDCKDLSTLVPWDMLTQHAGLIHAKHVLFIMDACYGGIILSRSTPVGGMRFFNDLLMRPVRQAIAAGKEDQTVADAGGPRKGHSMFTGHLLDALEGDAASVEGALTANGVMAYVYRKVGTDPASTQTPHYGLLSGDGDFIFMPPKPEKSDGSHSDAVDTDILVTIPSAGDVEPPIEDTSPVGVVKRLLSSPEKRVELDDFAVKHVRKVIGATAKEKFPVGSCQWAVEEFQRRLMDYEEATAQLRVMVATMAYWGEDAQRGTLTKAIARIADQIEPESGLVIWSALRWYPIILLCYAVGIAALASKRYGNLASIFGVRVSDRFGIARKGNLLDALGQQILDIERSNAFNQLPGYEKWHVPRSEHILKLLQPELDDALFLGRDYEMMFDRFEVFLALGTVVQTYTEEMPGSGPFGRFGYKYGSITSRGDNPLRSVIQEADEQKDNWPPLKAGLFCGDYNRFSVAAKAYETQTARLGWW